jgi:hypothetical protein
VIKVVDSLDGSLLEDAWTLYHEAFRDLNAYAVQRHLMHRHEFDTVMADGRIDKYLLLGDTGTLAGMSTFTRDLDAWPLISPAYFERRWPRRYAERRIWWVGFVAVDPEQGRPLHAFAALVEAMQLVVAGANGVVGLDICRYNADARHLDRASNLLVRRITSTVNIERADEQTFWLYEFPEAEAA